MFTAKLKMKEKESFFQKNGAAILEQIVNSFNGNCNLIRNYSIEELNKATNNFAWEGMMYEDSDLMVYKAVHEDRQVLVKRYFNEPSDGHRPWSDLADIANEVSIASQMSNHKNVLKLLGCCLDTELPILVYEFPENGNLKDYCTGGARQGVLPWETKLRIATDIANAVSYLHHGFSKTFIHRDLTLSNIFLDRDCVAKLSEFRLSVPIPEGKTHVDTAYLTGIRGYIAPEVMMKCRWTERSDVYSFGFLLCALLTEKSVTEMFRLYYGDEDDDNKNKNNESSYHYDDDKDDNNNEKEEEELIGSSEMNSEKKSASTDIFLHNFRAELKANVLEHGNEKQVMECGKLIERCLSFNTEDRPDMIEVAKALRFINNIK